MTNFPGVDAAGGDVVENPLLVPGFFLDVFGNSGAQPFQPFRQTGAASHEQRHCMLDVVICLDQESLVSLQSNGSLQAIHDHRLV